MMEIQVNNQEALEKLRTESKKYDLERYKSGVKKWLHIQDEEILDITAATIKGELVGGDPLWIFLVAPPGGTKTELLRSFQGDYAFHLSDMTSKTLIGGLMVGEGEKRRKVKDLLPQLDKKILIFKDFTTILEKSNEERREIISQFRECYDGSFSKKLGTVDDTIRYNSRFGLMAGVTPVIDRYWKLTQQLGERFLKIRWKEDADSVTDRARSNEGEEELMRKELSQNAEKFIKSLDSNPVPNFNDEEFGEYIKSIAKFVAISRTPLSIQDTSGEFYHDYIPTPEMPTRLVKQFKKLAKCLALVRGKSEVTWEEMKTIVRVAKDTIPPERFAIMETIVKYQYVILEGCPSKYIYNEVKIPKTSIRRVLEQLKLLELIKQKRVGSQTDYYNQYQEDSYHYTLSELPSAFFGTVPEKLEDNREGSSNSNGEIKR